MTETLGHIADNRLVDSSLTRYEKRNEHGSFLDAIGHLILGL